MINVHMLSSKKVQLISVLCLILSLLFVTLSPSAYVPKHVLINIRQEDFTFNIMFVGFDDEVILEEKVDDILPNIANPYLFASAVFPHSEYNLVYNFTHLEAEQTSDLIDYLESIAIDETNVGYRANTTLIGEYIEGEIVPEIEDVILPYNGTRFDAIKVENYLYENLYEPDYSQPGYTLFMMNFSQFDSDDHTTEHTFYVAGSDFDANSSIMINYMDVDIKDYMAVAGWGGIHRFSFIDISASLDYLFLLPIIYDDVFTGYGNYDYYLYDLDEFLKTVDVSTYNGQSSLAIYISDWIYSYIHTVFIPINIWEPPIIDSFSIPIKIFTNISDITFNRNSYSWFLSSYRIEEALSSAFPWIRWNVDIEYVDLRFDSVMYNGLDTYVENVADEYYLTLDTDLYNFLNDQLPDYFDLNESDVVLPYYVFVSDGLDYFIGTNGEGHFWGNNFNLIFRTIDNLFLEGDSEQPWFGSSSSVLRVVGHLLGQPFPISRFYGGGGVYNSDILTPLAREFCGTGNFSTYNRDATARNYYDFYFISTDNDFDSTMQDYEIIGPLVGAGKFINNIPELLAESYSYYSVMEYIPAIELAKEAYELQLEFEQFVENPSVFRKPGLFYPIVIGGSLIVIAIPSSILLAKGTIKIGKKGQL